MTTITLKKLNDRRENIQRAIEYALRFQQEDVNKILEIADKAGCGDDIRIHFYRPSIENKEIVQTLREYLYLIEDIIDTTAIDWPPTCLQSKKEV